MKKITGLLFITAALLMSCGGDKVKNDNVENGLSAKSSASTSGYDPKRGEGKFDESNVKFGSTIDPALVKKGQEVFDLKCYACHRLTDEKLIGPGWKGITERQTPQWIMNFITNPDPMIDKDPELQAQLELCLVRMTNQNLSEEDARGVLELMRQNDGMK